MLLSRTWRSRWVAHSLGSLVACSVLLSFNIDRMGPEIDRMGLRFMAKAGYDPRAALKVAKREGALAKFSYHGGVSIPGPKDSISVRSLG